VDLRFAETMIDATPVVAVSGSVDLSTVPALRSTLLRAVGRHPGAVVVVDLDGVDVLDDTGLGILLGAADHARQRDGDVAIVCTDERLRQRLARSRLDRAVTVSSSITAAQERTATP